MWKRARGAGTAADALITLTMPSTASSQALAEERARILAPILGEVSERNDAIQLCSCAASGLAASQVVGEFARAG